MTENKCISKICLIGFDENIIKVVEEDNENKWNQEVIENNEIEK